MNMHRRDLLQAIVAAGGVGLAGCGGRAVADPETETTPTQTPDQPSEKTPTQSPTSTPTATSTPHPALSREWNWEFSGDCGDYSMPHDSIIKVEAAVTEIPEQKYEPIYFSNLTSGEKEMLRTVITEGGYGTCDSPDPLDNFMQRAFAAYDRQTPDVGEEHKLYLEHENIYYRLIVRENDQFLFW